MEPEAKQDEHQQETAEGQPEAPTSEHVGGRECSHSRQEKEHPPQPRLRRWENVGSGLQILFNFFVMLFTGGLFYLTYGQLEVAREATEATKKAADAAIIAAQVAQGQLEEMKGSSADTRAVADAAKAQAANTEKLAVAAEQQSRAAKDFAEAAKSSALTAAQTLTLSHRPWVRAKHQIIGPLRFMVSPTVQARLDIHEVLENIGQSVAIDIVSWSDIFPSDPNWGFQDALNRRNNHCDTLRYLTSPLRSGSVLFPKQEYPPDLKLLVSRDLKKAISAATLERSGPELVGKVGFVVVGCVSYRASFEAPDVHRHQTRFIYTLGHPNMGNIRTAMHVKPSGTAPDLGLVLIPEATTAD